MPIEERFDAKMGTVLGVQIRPISGVTTATVTGITMFLNNITAERNGVISFRVDGLDYEIRFEFTDETLENRTLTGALKLRNPRA